MSVRVMSQAWELPLTPTEKLVILALADCANDEGECWPSIATIARKSNLGERSVQRSIQALKDAGHLSRNEVAGKGCRYTIHPRHSVTPATKSPVPHSRKPPPQCHPTPATVAPKPSENHKQPSKDAYASKARVAAKPRKVAMTMDWEPTDLSGDVGEMLAQWPPGKLESELADFREYWTEDGTKRPGWDRTFRSRIRTIHDRVIREARNDRRNTRHTAQTGGGLAAPNGRPMGRTEAAARAAAGMVSPGKSGGDHAGPSALPDHRRAIGYVPG